MSDTKLMPCPFCGQHPLCHYDGNAWHVRCNNPADGIRPHISMWDKEHAIAAWNTRVPDPAAEEDSRIKVERVKSRLLGVEDAISAFSDESLMAENKALIDAIDEEMVSCHLGAFNTGDDPRKAINMLMCWAQGVGEYFALHPIDKDDKNAWLKTPMLSSTALTHRSERDINAILANRRARLTEGPDRNRRLAAAEGPVKALEADKMLRDAEKEKPCNH